MDESVDVGESPTERKYRESMSTGRGFLLGAALSVPVWLIVGGLLAMLRALS